MSDEIIEGYRRDLKKLVSDFGQYVKVLSETRLYTCPHCKSYKEEVSVREKIVKDEFQILTGYTEENFMGTTYEFPLLTLGIILQHECGLAKFRLIPTHLECLRLRSLLFEQKEILEKGKSSYAQLYV